jgi:hypothetical protein
MMKAVAKKPLPDHHNKKNHDASREALKSSHTINSDFRSPAVQLKPICPCDGGCSRCAGVIQPKLTIGQPNDVYEQEADRVAEEVMRMPDTVVSDQPSVVRKEDEAVQRKPT